MDTNKTMVPGSMPKGLNIALWIVQSLLAAMFIMVGFMKLTKPEAFKDIPVGLVYFIGASELLGGLGLLLPSLLRIKPVLTPIAAVGIAIIMALAVGFHIMVKVYGPIGFVLLLLALAVFVAWGRFTKARILPKD